MFAFTSVHANVLNPVLSAALPQGYLPVSTQHNPPPLGLLLLQHLQVRVGINSEVVQSLIVMFASAFMQKIMNN